MNVRFDGKAERMGCVRGPGAAPEPDVLMIFLEPAPYILTFVEAARTAWTGRIDVLYSAAQLTQNWGYAGARENDIVLPPSFPLAMAEIKRRIASGGYGLLHLAGWGHPLLWRAMLYARRRMPVTVQSDTPAPRGEPAWKRLVKRVVYRALFRIPAMFTPAGTPQADYIRSFGVPARRIRIAQLAADIQHIRKVPHAAAPPTLLYVGRLEPHKGIEDMLEAFAELVRTVPEARLLIAGDGSLRDRVARAAADCPGIRYLGRLAGDELGKAYALADIALVPSRFEPWGLVVNQAMAAALPVIATDCVGSAPDLIRDGSSGIVVPTASPRDLARAMVVLCMQPDLRQQMGSRAIETIAAWTPANQAANTLAAWREALDGR